MGQRELMEIFESHVEPLTANQLILFTGRNKSSVNHALRQMVKFGHIERIKRLNIKQHESRYIYKLKR